MPSRSYTSARFGVVDAGDDLPDAEGLAGHPRGDDVRVVAVADRRERLRLLDPGGRSSVSRSKPTPVTCRPGKSSPSRRNASGSWSITATLCSSRSRCCASAVPTRPQPMITMCTRGTSPFRTLPVPRREVCRRPARHQRARRYTTRADRDTPSVRRRVARGRIVRLVALLTRVLKRLIIGSPVRSEQAGHSLLPKRLALPIFASDALSSVAYATQEILLVLTRRRHRVPLPRPVGRGRRRRPDGRRRGVLPAAGAGLPDRGRRLRGRDQEHRQAGRRGRRQRAAGRLRDDGAGVGLLRRRQHHLGGAVAAPRSGW